MIRLLPLTIRHIEEWPLALNDTIDQTVQVYPQQKDRLYFLLQELDKPTLTNVVSLNRLRETYVWIEAHLL